MSSSTVVERPELDQTLEDIPSAFHIVEKEEETADRMVRTPLREATKAMWTYKASVEFREYWKARCERDARKLRTFPSEKALRRRWREYRHAIQTYLIGREAKAFMFCLKQGETEDADDTDVDEPFDTTGKRDYKRACKSLKVRCCTLFLVHCMNTHMPLGHFGLLKRDARALARGLRSNTELTSVDLQHNQIMDDGCEAIFRAMQENVYILKLDVSYNQLTLTSVEALQQLFAHNTTLRRLSLAGNKLGDRCAKTLADILRVVRYLRALDLGYNEFGETGGKRLGPGLAANESVEELSLRWNHLRMDGAVAIARGLAKNQMLKVLDLSWNGFGDEGAAAMGRALKENFTLVSLDLSHNRITEDGAKLFAKGIAVNDALKVLRLGNNPLQMAGVSAVLLAMKSNANNMIEKLYFDNISITLNLLDLLSDMKKTRPGLDICHGGLGGVEQRAQSEKRKAPMVLIKQYIDRANLRLVDFFNSLDKDKNMTITPNELEAGLRLARVNLTRAQIHELVEKLDTDGDGAINYCEFVYGAQQATEEVRESLKKATRLQALQEQVAKRLTETPESLASKSAKNPLENSYDDYEEDSD